MIWDRCQQMISELVSSQKTSKRSIALMFHVDVLIVKARIFFKLHPARPVHEEASPFMTEKVFFNKPNWKITGFSPQLCLPNRFS